MKFSIEERRVMTRLEWCRANAPKAYAGYSDEELLHEMDGIHESPQPAEEVYCLSDIDPFLNPIDEMIRIFAGIFGNKCSFSTGYIGDKVSGGTDAVFKYVSDLGLYDQLLAALDAACSEFVKDGLATNYTLRKAASPDFTCGATLFQADDVLLDVSLSWNSSCYDTVSVSFDSINGKHTEVERLIANKVLNLFESDGDSTAIDLYDLYCLTNCFDFNPIKMRNYISMLTHDVPFNYAELTPHREVDVQRYENDYAGLRIISNCVHGDVPKPEFYDVMGRFYSMCRILIYKSAGIWEHKDCWLNLSRK